jgi:hypothetical protein
MTELIYYKLLTPIQPLSTELPANAAVAAVCYITETDLDLATLSTCRREAGLTFATGMMGAGMVLLSLLRECHSTLPVG